MGFSPTASSMHGLMWLIIGSLFTVVGDRSILLFGLESVSPAVPKLIHARARAHEQLTRSDQPLKLPEGHYRYQKKNRPPSIQTIAIGTTGTYVHSRSESLTNTILKNCYSTYYSAVARYNR